MRLPGLALGTIIAAGCATAQAQGCAQCLDGVQGTPARTQTAYRHAIELLAGAGIAVFSGGVWLMRVYGREPE